MTEEIDRKLEATAEAIGLEIAAADVFDAADPRQMLELCGRVWARIAPADSEAEAVNRAFDGLRARDRFGEPIEEPAPHTLEDDCPELWEDAQGNARYCPIHRPKLDEERRRRQVWGNDFGAPA